MLSVVVLQDTSNAEAETAVSLPSQAVVSILIWHYIDKLLPKPSFSGSKPKPLERTLSHTPWAETTKYLLSPRGFAPLTRVIYTIMEDQEEDMASSLALDNREVY